MCCKQINANLKNQGTRNTYGDCWNKSEAFKQFQFQDHSYTNFKNFSVRDIDVTHSKSHYCLGSQEITCKISKQVHNSTHMFGIKNNESKGYGKLLKEQKTYIIELCREVIKMK